MGLDMYAFSRMPMNQLSDEQKEKIMTDVIEHGEATNDPIEIAYWRKHNALHGWMERLYREKGGEDEFNCIDLLLTSEDLDRLEKDIKESKLYPVEGFFFGGDYDPATENSKDIAFIRKAREELEEGNEVYYTSWW